MTPHRRHIPRPSQGWSKFNREYSPVLIVIWTAVTLAAVTFNLSEQKKHSEQQALVEARTYYELNLAYRAFVSQMGGVYGPVDKVSPNPYLHVPNRDITASDGRRLTLINPAYMTRLVFDVLQQKFRKPIKNKLTSLKYLNPDNRPNEWEQSVLAAFEQGSKEAYRVTEVEGNPYLLLMKPFYTEESCLKCHANQGYRVGDVRGGISVAVPLSPHYASSASFRKQAVLSYAAIWLVGCAGLVTFSRRRYRESIVSKENEWKFMTVLESTGDCEYWLNAQNRIEYISPSCAELTGYEQAEIIENSGLLSDIVHPDDKALVQKHRERFGQDERYQLEFRIIARNGAVKWLSHSCMPLYRNGVFVGRRVSDRDITDRRNAEAALRQEQTFSDVVIDSLPGIFYICDEDGKLLRWNTNEKVVTGYSGDELTRMSIFQLFPLDRDLLAQKMGEVIHDGKAYVEASIVTKSGVAIPFFLTGCRMRQNSRDFIVGVGTDISEKKHLEQQLIQSQKMEAIGLLAGGVAHDFNNILSAIIGYSCLLNMKLAADNPLRNYSEQILQSADRAAQVTHSLLTFSRKQPLILKPVDLNGVLDQMGTFLKRIIGADITLKTELSREPLVVMADRSQIDQVMMNLATNARDAMPKGGELIVRSELVELDEAFVHAHAFGTPARYALITVSDTGIGMDEATRSRIFEPFFTTKSVGKGTGLGLAIVYGIIKQHNGFISVYSEPGKGTIFKIYLLTVEAQESRNLAPAVSPLPRSGSETIFVAEDEERLRSLLEIMLKEYGYRVVAAVDGEEAVEKFRENKDTIRLALVDMIMPKRNGKEVYNEIIRIKPEVKVLFMSGYTADKIRKEGLLVEGVELLMKPISPSDLLNKVRAVLDA